MNEPPNVAGRVHELSCQESVHILTTPSQLRSICRPDRVSIMLQCSTSSLSELALQPLQTRNRSGLPHLPNSTWAATKPPVTRLPSNGIAFPGYTRSRLPLPNLQDLVPALLPDVCLHKNFNIVFVQFIACRSRMSVLSSSLYTMRQSHSGPRKSAVQSSTHVMSSL